MDLEKEYAKVDRKVVQGVMKRCGARSHTVEAVKNIYEGSESCVRLCNEENGLFKANGGLRQGCVMSLWLFN